MSRDSCGLAGPARIRSWTVVDARRGAATPPATPRWPGREPSPAGTTPCKVDSGAVLAVYECMGPTAPSASALRSGALWPNSAECADRMACRGASSRSVRADGEDRSMAQTDQAWDWGVELRDEERSELELLRRTVAQMRTQLDQARESLRSCRQRQQDAREALRQLDEARPLRRRRVRRALRERHLL
jgi:hypothetical protein